MRKTVGMATSRFEPKPIGVTRPRRIGISVGANYRLLAGRNSNAKTAQYRLVDTDAGDDENTPPGEQLSLDATGSSA